jgi:NDP-sugar pyrophosphorylase family protein
MSDYLQLLQSTSGFERVWAYISWANQRDGYYTPDELIDLSLRNEFHLDNPLTRIRKGTKILKNAIINGSVVEGENVIIGENTVLEQARIVGSNIEIGRSNLIRGNILIDNLAMNDFNKVKDLQGTSPKGKVSLGSHNIIDGLTINNGWDNPIRIGDSNLFHPGLTLNNPFSRGFIYIGNGNDLGNGGGGVISSSFRYARGWGGHVVIGSNVEMTRGAEIGGFSLVGCNMETLQELGYSQGSLISTFSKAGPEDLLDLLEQVSQALSESPSMMEYKKVGLFGTVKTKRCCIIGSTRLRDDVRIQGSFLRNTEIRERCKVFYSAIYSNTSVINLNISDRAIEEQRITEEATWENYPTSLVTDDYLPVDYDFYEGKSA